jgi:anti-anti-sigma factor
MMDGLYLNNGGNTMITFLMNEVDGHLNVKLEGDLDIDATEIINEKISIMEKYKVVNINFASVPFVDSSGIGLLVHLVQSMDEKGVKITISDVREDVMAVFELLQIPEIIGKDVIV